MEDEDEGCNMSAAEIDEGPVNVAAAGQPTHVNKLSCVHAPAAEEELNHKLATDSLAKKALELNAGLRAGVKPKYFACILKNCTKNQYKLQYGDDKARKLMEKFEGLLNDNKNRLQDAPDPKKQRTYARIVWYY
jgi:hypothetical protein